MAEALARHYGMGRVEAFSAGVTPSPLNTWAVRVLAEQDIDISGHVPKGLDAVPIDKMDLVVTLCDFAHPLCPRAHPAQHRLHWSIKDPTGVWGPEWFVLRAYRKVRDDLNLRIRNLVVSLQIQAARSYIR